MKLKIQITRKWIIRIAVVIAFFSVASLLDAYLEKNPPNIVESQPDSSQSNLEHDLIYFSQTNTFSVKTPVQKTPDRKNYQQSHDKFLQKHHQVRNYQILKADLNTEKIPVFLTLQHRIFRKYLYSVPDDDPLIS